MIRLKHNRPRPCFTFKISNYKHGKVIPYVTRVTQDHFHSIFHFAPQHCKFFIVAVVVAFVCYRGKAVTNIPVGHNTTGPLTGTHCGPSGTQLSTQGLSLRPTVGIISSLLASPSYINPFFEDKVVR